MALALVALASGGGHPGSSVSFVAAATEDPAAAATPQGSEPREGAAYLEGEFGPGESDFSGSESGSGQALLRGNKNPHDRRLLDVAGVGGGLADLIDGITNTGDRKSMEYKYQERNTRWRWTGESRCGITCTAVPGCNIGCWEDTSYRWCVEEESSSNIWNFPDTVWTLYVNSCVF